MRMPTLANLSIDTVIMHDICTSVACFCFQMAYNFQLLGCFLAVDLLVVMLHKKHMVNGPVAGKSHECACVCMCVFVCMLDTRTCVHACMYVHFYSDVSAI